MDTKTIGALTGAALLSLAAPAVVTFSEGAVVEISDGDPSEAIGIADVARRGDVVTGTIVNRGTDVVRDVRLLIDVPFLWANETKPGDDSPGRSTIMTVAGPLEPQGRLAFEFTPNPPLSPRTDGHYAAPEVHVLGYQSVTIR